MLTSPLWLIPISPTIEHGWPSPTEAFANPHLPHECVRRGLVDAPVHRGETLHGTVPALHPAHNPAWTASDRVDPDPEDPIHGEVGVFQGSNHAMGYLF